MVREFDEHGVRFAYPDDWSTGKQEADTGWMLHLQSPGTAFMVLHVDRTMPSPQNAAAEILRAMQAEYPDLEIEERSEQWAGRHAVGYDLHFFALDLTNSCSARSFRTEEATYSLMWQATDEEWEEFESAVAAIRESFEIDEGPTGFPLMPPFDEIR